MVERLRDLRTCVFQSLIGFPSDALQKRVRLLR
jgi:hypothetical protein